MIFIMPPSFEELRAPAARRARPRTDAAIERRLARAKEEMAAVLNGVWQAPRQFDYVIVNESISEASDELARIIRTNQGTRMNKPTVDEILEGLACAREAETEEPNRYTAVMVTAKRARQINCYYHSLGEGGGLDAFAPPPVATFSKNYLSIAMAEAARGEIAYRLRPSR